MRASIKPVHLTRVAAYTTDAVPWLMLLAVIAEAVWANTVGRSFWLAVGNFELALLHALVAPTIIVGGVTMRLASALRRYVRFPQAWPAAMAFGLIVLLGWVAVVTPWII